MWTIKSAKDELPNVNIKIANIILPAQIKDASDGYCCVYSPEKSSKDIGGFAIAITWEAVIKSLNEEKPILS